jgi:hypothetical protein
VPAPDGQAEVAQAKAAPAKTTKKEVKKESPGFFSREYWLGTK